MLRNNLEKVFVISLYILVFGLFSSVTIIGVASLIFFVLFLILEYSQIKKIKEDPLFYPILFLIIAILLSMISAAPYSYMKPLSKIRFFLFYFMFVLVLPKLNQNKLNRFIVGIGILSGLVCILQFYGINIFEFISLKKQRFIPHSEGRLFHATGFMTFHIFFATNCLFIFNLAYSRLLTMGWNVYYFLGTILSMFGIILSFSRGGWIGLFVSFLFTSILYSKKLFFKMIVLIVLVVGILTLCSDTFRERLSNIKPSSNLERIYLWQISLDMFNASPIFGMGFHSFSERSHAFWKKYPLGEDSPNSPHSMYMDMLGGTGIVGFIAFLYFLFRGLIILLKNIKKDKIILGVAGGFFSYIIVGIFDNQFFMTVNLLCMFFFLAMGISRSSASGTNQAKLSN